MSADFKVVVSSENNAYMAWQTQLFCFSALTRLRKHPTVVVHTRGGPLFQEFLTVRSWGCQVVEAGSYRNHPKCEYPPRNEVGSLLRIASMSEFADSHVLFCEPDMLFVQRPAYSEQLSGEYYDHLDYREGRVQAVAKKIGILDRIEKLNISNAIGVPYLIPGRYLSDIAGRWMEVLDSFEEPKWIDIMYAFGLAVAAEGLAAKITHVMVDNRDPLQRLDKQVIHYYYGDWRWDKHSFGDGRTPLRAMPVTSSERLTGTVLGEMLSQIQHARAYDRAPRLLKAIWKFGAKFSG